MSDSQARVRSFLGWAFLLSVVLHAVTLPFLGVRARAHEKTESESFSIGRIARIVRATPPPPTPAPRAPRPTSVPSAAPVPRHAAAQLQRHEVAIVALPADRSVRAGHASDAPNDGGETGSRQGLSTGAPATEPESTSAPSVIPATVAPTVPPTATPKPSCPSPHVDAAIKGAAVAPDVPDVERERGESGTTDVEVTLDANGTPVDVTVHTSSGFAALDRAALEAARATAYTPAIVDCVKTAGRYLFRADFETQ